MVGASVVPVPGERGFAAVAVPLTAYDLLGVPPEAGAAEITSAYRRLLRRHHPDSRDVSQADRPVDDGLGTDAAAALRMIIEAYEVLRDPRSRADYDRRLEGHTPTKSSFQVGGDQDFIVRAGPVQWSDEPAPTGSVKHSSLTGQELQLMNQLVSILYRRWDYW